MDDFLLFVLTPNGVIMVLLNAQIIIKEIETMEKLLASIFDHTREVHPKTKQIERKITDEITKLLTPYEPTLSPMDYEKLRDLLFESSLIAEKQGFILGFEYAKKLLIPND